MEDRAVAIMANYEMTVLSSSKGRGVLLCETDSGTVVLQEYRGPVGKAAIIDELMHRVLNCTEILVDEFIRNKEGELLSVDRDRKIYIVKKYLKGRECASKDEKDLCAAMRCLARIHLCTEQTDIRSPQMYPFSPEDEMLRHNREMNRVRNFIRGRQPKTDFELVLLKYYQKFAEQASTTVAKMQQEDFSSFYAEIAQKGQFTHGDYQYHNVQFVGDEPAVLNFEHCQWDSCVRDVALMLRKTMEKSDWNEELGNKMLTEYEAVRALRAQERRQLYYRLAYPEKFWKILNSYFNSNKAFISMQYMGKLETLLNQEDAKVAFLKHLL